MGLRAKEGRARRKPGGSWEIKAGKAVVRVLEADELHCIIDRTCSRAQTFSPHSQAREVNPETLVYESR